MHGHVRLAHPPCPGAQGERRGRLPLRRARPLLGTLVAIRIDRPPAGAGRAFAAAFAAIDAVHCAMSFHEPASELSRLNRDAVRVPQAVGPQLWRVLRASLAVARASDGCFDPTVAPRLVQWRQLPTPAGAGAPDPAATWRDIRLLPDRRVFFDKPLWLDLGGIAKGYAVDRAVAALRRVGVSAGVVNAGGDLRVFGDHADTIHVRDPRSPGRAYPLLQVREGAVATSAGYYSARDDRTALLDPRSGHALGHDVSVSVCAARAVWADALTKVVLADETIAVRLLRRLRAQAAIIGADGATRTLR